HPTRCPLQRSHRSTEWTVGSLRSAASTISALSSELLGLLHVAIAAASRCPTTANGHVSRRDSGVRAGQIVRARKPSLRAERAETPSEPELHLDQRGLLLAQPEELVHGP